jgi:16S rRNA (uracil1498-N3)-methyltransferase
MIVLLESGAVGRRGRLEASEAHRLRVRRARDGEGVELRDGAGLVGAGRLVWAGREWEVEVERVERRPRPADFALVVGAGDRDRFSWVVEKAAELGVTSVVPLETERTAGVATRVRAQHVEKLRRTALEALRQCGSAWACEVTEPVALAELVARPLGGTAWMADASAAPAPPVIGGSPLAVVVGPEGGLTARERDLLRAAGYLPVALGPHTLRFETAAIAAAAAAAMARLRGHHG